MFRSNSTINNPSSVNSVGFLDPPQFQIYILGGHAKEQFTASAEGINEKGE